jgi:poly(A) polymerase
VEPRIIERSQHPISRRDIDPNVLKVLYRLIGANHIAYLVGGGVRDLMMGRPPKDFDVATSAHPHQVRDLFRNSRLIGRRFRLVHVFFGHQNIEVATFRRLSEEVAGDDLLIRHDNTFGTPREDAFRRDFTVNALFYDPRTFHVIDYAGGVFDLNARLIRTVGDPDLRMREDPVRMLRAVRFAAKLGFEIESATHAAIERHRQDLLKASVPRLVEEIYRTFSLSSAARALELMQELGLLDVLMPRAAHLRFRDERGEKTPAARNMEALGTAIDGGAAPSHAVILTCLYLDLYLERIRSAGTGAMADLLADLRLRGFSRADTEHMRLLLEAFAQMLAPSRRLRRLAQRPYFEEALRFYEMVGPSYLADPAGLMRFLAHAPSHAGHRLEQQASPPSPPGNGQRRRRRHRGGARRHRQRSHFPRKADSMAQSAVSTHDGAESVAQGHRNETAIAEPSQPDSLLAR